jgi:hypothetical protein
MIDTARTKDTDRDRDYWCLERELYLRKLVQQIALDARTVVAHLPRFNAYADRYRVDWPTYLHELGIKPELLAAIEAVAKLAPKGRKARWA